MNDTWVHQQKLTAPNRRQNDSFFAVRVSGDTALVTGSNTLREPRGAGWVNVFTRRGDTWYPQQRLTTDPQVHDAFGSSIDLDEETIVVGASLDDNARPDGGTAHVFTRTNEEWTLQQILTPTDADSRDRFGYSASISGDTVLVGSIYEDELGPVSSNAGAAYVFTRDGTTWTQQQKLLVTDGEYDDYIGADVSLDGDTALVGTGGADAAYVFTRDGTTWTQQQELTVTEGSINSSVWVDGDVALVAGTTEEYLGAIHVFTRRESTWSHRQTLTGADIGQDDGLRAAFSLDDGTALIGTSEGGKPGTAYIFG